MISFWVTDAAKFGIEIYRQNRGQAIGDRFRTELYDDVARGIQLRHGPQIFAALDQLTDTQRQVVAAIWDAHAQVAPAATRLNDPRRVLRRFDLLHKLHQLEMNRFRVWRATDVGDVDRFPVFVRLESDHGGPATGLLMTQRDVASALRALRLRGHRLQDLIIVEFLDTMGPDRWFRKYSAFRVGGSIIPCHAMVSRQWSVKSDHNRPDEVAIREEVAFIESNPHEAWLRRVFDVASIGYGRADYGIVDGLPQVWEINMNPTLGRASGSRRQGSLPPELSALRDRGREAFHDKLKAAFVGIDTSPNERETTIRIEKPLLSRLQSEAVADRRRQRRLTWLKRLYRHPRLGMAARLAYTKLFPPR